METTMKINVLWDNSGSISDEDMKLIIEDLKTLSVNNPCADCAIGCPDGIQDRCEDVCDRGVVVRLTDGYKPDCSRE